FVAFKGMPFGSSASDTGNSYLGANAGTPEAAAAKLAAAPGAVAKDPVAGARVGLGGGAGDPKGTGGPRDPSGDPSFAGDPSAPGDPSSPGDPVPCLTCSTSGSGIVGNTVNDVGSTTGQDLSGPTA